ncbi:hypothetical protein TNCV_3219881 [Trichonephila clavipes]|nr:hypothetical protein TNCV_3219881 [Trichonephila clavipes]
MSGLGTKRDRDKRRNGNLLQQIEEGERKELYPTSLKFRYDEISRSDNLVVQNKGLAATVSMMRGPQAIGAATL